MNDFFHPSEAGCIFFKILADLRTGLDTAVTAAAFFLHVVLQRHGGPLVLIEHHPGIDFEDGAGVDAISAGETSAITRDQGGLHQTHIFIHASGEQAEARHRTPWIIKDVLFVQHIEFKVVTHLGTSPFMCPEFEKVYFNQT